MHQKDNSTHSEQSQSETTILVAEDEQMTRNLLYLSLQRLGYRTITAQNGQEAVRLFEQHAVDLVVLDVLMPGLDGLATCIEIRKRSNVPIIMLTALSRPDDIVRGLDMGADNYITKPFTFKEVEAKIRAVLRRAGSYSEQSIFEIIERGNVKLNSEVHEVTVAGRNVDLTKIEFELLHYLMAHADQPLSKDELLRRVWGYDAASSTNLVEIAIHRLRTKIEENPSDPHRLVTVRGIGYKFSTTGHLGNPAESTAADAPQHRTDSVAHRAAQQNIAKSIQS